MRPNSIALFTWGVSGGASTNYAAALANGFAELGVEEIHVVYLNGEVGRNVSLPRNAVPVPLGVSRAVFSPLPLARFLRTSRPDFLISTLSIINIPAILGWAISGRKATRLIVSEHATMSYEVYVEHAGDIRFRVIPALARWLYPRANGLQANSDEVLRDLLDTIGVQMHGRSISIPNPVNIEHVVQKSREIPSHPWIRNKDTQLILSVGRLAKQKNFELLIRALATVRQHENVRLLILGNGAYRNELEQLSRRLGLAEYVDLPGRVDNPWSYMAHADLFVLPSEAEAFGLVLVEAMACGIPVVATDAIGGGPRFILKGGKYGLLVPNGDEQALASGISQLLKDPSMRKYYSEKSLERCNDFRPAAIANQWLDFLGRLTR